MTMLSIEMKNDLLFKIPILFFINTKKRQKLLKNLFSNLCLFSFFSVISETSHALSCIFLFF
jgi:hypothetical protein